MKLYSEDHQWAELDGAHAVIGLSRYAAEEIGEVNFVELPEVGAQVAAGQPLCVIESMKAAADVLSPLSGTVKEVNSVLGSRPALLNTAPEGDGWICRITLSAPAEADSLMTEEEYQRRMK